MATKIQVVFYSMYGHIYKMAEAVAAVHAAIRSTPPARQARGTVCEDSRKDGAEEHRCSRKNTSGRTRRSTPPAAGPCRLPRFWPDDGTRGASGRERLPVARWSPDSTASNHILQSRGACVPGSGRRLDPPDGLEERARRSVVQPSVSRLSRP